MVVFLGRCFGCLARFCLLAILHRVLFVVVYCAAVVCCLMTLVARCLLVVCRLLVVSCWLFVVCF